MLVVRLQFSRNYASCSYRRLVYLTEIQGSTFHSRMKECIRDGCCTRIQGSLGGWCLGEWLEYSDSAVQEWGALAKMRMKGGLAQDTPIPKLLSAWRLIFTWRLTVCPLHPWRLFQLPSEAAFWIQSLHSQVIAFFAKLNNCIGMKSPYPGFAIAASKELFHNIVMQVISCRRLGSVLAIPNQLKEKKG